MKIRPEAFVEMLAYKLPISLYVHSQSVILGKISMIWDRRIAYFNARFFEPDLCIAAVSTMYITVSSAGLISRAPAAFNLVVPEHWPFCLNRKVPIKIFRRFIPFSSQLHEVKIHLDSGSKMSGESTMMKDAH